MNTQPLVSIVIPTYNSGKTLGACLKSIKNQTYKNIQIIIVDKNSADKTVQIAKHYGARVIIGDWERSAARNKGIKESKGEYILSIDSDMELTPRVIEECLQIIQSDNKIGGVVIPERSVGNPFWAKVRDFERSFYAHSELESARFFKRDLVIKVGGFDEEIIFFEDSSLPQKIEELGYNVRARINSVILHHENDFSLWKWLKKKYYYGKTAWKYKSRYRRYATKQMNLFFRIRLFLNNRRFFSKPLLALAVLLLKSLEYFSVMLGSLTGKFARSKDT